MTALGGIGHTLPYLIPDAWPNAFYVATGDRRGRGRGRARRDLVDPHALHGDAVLERHHAGHPRRRARAACRHLHRQRLTARDGGRELAPPPRRCLTCSASPTSPIRMSARCRGPKVRELFSKRVTGWFNWHRSRAHAHDMEHPRGARRRHPRRRARPHRLHRRPLQHRPAERMAAEPRLHGGARAARGGELRAGQPRRLRQGRARRAPAPRSRRGRAATTARCAASPMCAGAGRSRSSGCPRRSRRCRSSPAARSGESSSRRPSSCLPSWPARSCFRIVMIHHPPHVGGAPRGPQPHRRPRLRGDDRACRRRARDPRPQPCRLARLAHGAAGQGAGDRRALGVGARRHARAQRRLLPLSRSRATRPASRSRRSCAGSRPTAPSAASAVPGPSWPRVTGVVETTPALPPSALKVRDAAERLGLAIAIRDMPQSTRTADEAAAACGCDVGADRQVARLRRQGDAARPICSWSRAATG